LGYRGERAISSKLIARAGSIGAGAFDSRAEKIANTTR
jgi:hypothetical protein